MVTARWRTRSSRGTVANVISGIGGVIALILLFHILFTLAGANAANSLVQFIAYWAGIFALWFVGIFTTGSLALQVIVDYGLAMLFWLLITGFLARVVSRV